jgi:hypothetical protein
MPCRIGNVDLFPLGNKILSAAIEFIPNLIRGKNVSLFSRK